MLVAIVLLVVTLEVTGTDYKTYINGGQHINFLLGPATVALAVPLYEQRLRLAKMWVALTCGLVAGGTVAIVSVVLIAGALGASPETIDFACSQERDCSDCHGCKRTPRRHSGSDCSTGRDHRCCRLFDGSRLLGILREKDDAVRGFSIGLAAHGVGTATAFQMNRDTGAFSGLAMGLTGLFTAFAAPFLLPYLLRLFE